MKKALVCGAGGFIGHHLVKRLKSEGYFVLGVDLKYPEFSSTFADRFWRSDLRLPLNCAHAVADMDEVYQLAADMGGMGYLHSHECEIMRNNALINSNMVHAAAAANVKRYFFSSSVCVYRDMKESDAEISEDGAYPAMPENNYGWEKLYAERMALAYGRKYGFAVRIARFQNTYGPEGTWTGGREKAPAAICRKVAEATDGGEIEIWGDGKAIRSFTYIDDTIDGIRRLMDSNIEDPTNIGSPEYVSVRTLVKTVAAAAQKKVSIKSVGGHVGVQSRNFSLERIYSTGWKCRFTLEQGILLTYPWIAEQVEKSKLATV